MLEIQFVAEPSTMMQQVWVNQVRRHRATTKACPLITTASRDLSNIVTFLRHGQHKAEDVRQAVREIERNEGFPVAQFSM